MGGRAGTVPGWGLCSAGRVIMLRELERAGWDGGDWAWRESSLRPIS